MTRDEHVAWCKERALAYVAIGDLKNAMASMLSDLSKHPETQNHAGCEMGLMLSMSGHLSTAYDMKRFIEGFN